jgi:uncharacterized protein (TIRG00374 family)
VALAALVFVGFAIYVDLTHLIAAAQTFAWGWLLPMSALAFCNYFLRGVRLHFYLRVLGIDIRLSDSLTVSWASLVSSVTPGKAGEIVKVVFLRNLSDVPVATSASAVIAERMTDVMAMVMLASVGLTGLDVGLPVVLAVGAGVVVFWLALQVEWIVNGVLGALGSLPYVGRAAQPLKEAYGSIKVLIGMRQMAGALSIALVAWLAECVALDLALDASGHALGLARSSFVYAASTLIGALSMLPGGLGPTEGSMAAMLIGSGVGEGAAAVVTLFVRLCTLWLAVIVGAVVLVANRARLGGLRTIGELQSD